MVRTIPPDRFDALIRAATLVFLDRGYRRTQMADVAGAAGCAKGTLYLYFEGKEALFEQVLLAADVHEPIAPPTSLPIPNPPRRSTLRKVRTRVEQSLQLPALTAALARKRPVDPRAEVESISREIYALLAGHRVAIELIDRCAIDFPDLAALWSGQARGGLVDSLERFLRTRVGAGRIAPTADPAMTARIWLEVLVQWAVHAHWDALTDPQERNEEATMRSVVEFVTRSLCSEAIA